MLLIVFLIVAGIIIILGGLLMLLVGETVIGLLFVALGISLIVFRKKIYESGKKSRDRYIEELNSRNEVLDTFSFEAWEAIFDCEVGSGSRQDSIAASEVGDPVDIEVVPCEDEDADDDYEPLVCVNARTGKDVGIVRDIDHRGKVEALMERYRTKAHISSIKDRHTDASGDFKSAIVTIECFKK